MHQFTIDFDIDKHGSLSNYDFALEFMIAKHLLFANYKSRGKFCNNRNFSLFTFCTIANQRAPIRSRDELLRVSRVVAVEKTIGKLPSRRLVAAKIYFRRSFRNFKSVLSDKFPNQGCLPTFLLYLVFAK